jgi:hypothetical protein
MTEGRTVPQGLFGLLFSVMAGLDPAIHVPVNRKCGKARLRLGQNDRLLTSDAN